MPTDEDSLSEVFDVLLSRLEHVLSVDQIWELQTVIDYDEHELAFEMLGAMLRQARAPVPQGASALLRQLAHQLRVDPALCRDVCN